MNEQTENNQPAGEQPNETLPSVPGQQSPEPQPAGRLSLNWIFAIGFLSWYLVVGLLYWSQMKDDPQGYGAMLSSLFIFPAQLIALGILFAIKDLRNAGWGVLSAIALNLLISLILGLSFNALCFVPFFAPVSW